MTLDCLKAGLEINESGLMSGHTVSDLLSEMPVLRIVLGLSPLKTFKGADSGFDLL